MTTFPLKSDWVDKDTVGHTEADWTFAASDQNDASGGINAAYGMSNGIWLNVKDPAYGAIGDGSADDTAAFTAALTAAKSATLTGNTVTVFVPPGLYITGPLTLENRVSIRGAGVGASRLLLKSGSTIRLIGIATNARMCGVHDLYLDGNKANATNANCHGLVLDNSAALDTDPGNSISEWVDARHFVSNVYIQNFKGTGFKQIGRGACASSNVSVFYCDGHGFDIQTDCQYVNCEAGSSGLDGFIIRGASNRLTNCNPWYSGRISTVAETDGSGHGFHVEHGNYSANSYANCCAQDNARAGFYMNTAGRQVFTGCNADSNNTANLGHAGVEMISASVNFWSGITWDRDANATKQLAGVRVNGGAAGNIIHAVVSGLATMPEDSITTDSYVTGNDVILQDQATDKHFMSGSLLRRCSVQASTWTIDPRAGVAVFTGTTATWTLPTLAGNTGLEVVIKNRGSGNLTVQRTGTDQIYSTSAVNSVTVAAGASLRLVSDETYWCVV